MRLLAMTLSLIVMAIPNVVVAQDTTTAYFVIAHKSGNPNWQYFGESDTRQLATDRVKEVDAAGYEATVVIATIATISSPGSSPIFNGEAFISFSDLDYRNGRLARGAPNVFKIRLMAHFRRMVDSSAQKTILEKIQDLPKRERVRREVIRFQQKAPDPDGDGISLGDILGAFIDIAKVVLPIILAA